MYNYFMLFFKLKQPETKRKPTILVLTKFHPLFCWNRKIFLSFYFYFIYKSIIYYFRIIHRLFVFPRESLSWFNELDHKLLNN
jgi:hypothetical protein